MPADDPDILHIEVDTVWAGATAHSLGSDLTPALSSVGLPTRISFEYVGEHQVYEYRSAGSVFAEAVVTVYALRIFLPTSLSDALVERAVDALVAQIRRWRRRTKHTRLEVPIYRPDGKTILRRVEPDDDGTVDE